MKVLLHRKSRRELRMNLACGIQSLKGMNKEEGWLVSGFNEVREAEQKRQPVAPDVTSRRQHIGLFRAF